MTTLVTVTFMVEQDGDHWQVHEDTQTHGNTWAEVYRGMVAIRDEINRQIDEKKNCPYNPLNVRQNGEPNFEDNNG